jgi:hypothetical protein
MASTPLEDVRDTAIAAGVVLAFSAAVVFAFDVPITMSGFVVFAIVVAGLSYLSKQTGDVTIGFVLVSTGIIALLVEYVLPGAIVEPFEGPAAAVVSWIGFDPFKYIEPFPFFVLSIAATAVIIALRIRISGERKSSRPITDLVLKEFQRYFDNYANIARLIGVFIFGLIFILLQQSAELSGNIGDLVAQAPLVASNIVVAVSGFLSLGGDLPIIGDLPLIGALTAAEFAIFAIAVIFVAAAVKWQGSGPLSQFLKSR